MALPSAVQDERCRCSRALQDVPFATLALNKFTPSAPPVDQEETIENCIITLAMPQETLAKIRPGREHRSPCPPRPG